jgi:uncharacterized protein
MKINVKRIPEQGEQLVGTESPAILGIDEPDVHFEGEVRYDLFAQLQGHALLVTGKLQTPATLRCSRCLKTLRKLLAVREFVFHQELTGEDFVDLTDNIREDIILELPQRALCQDDCQGLCPHCGQNLNEGTCQCEKSHGDMRWHALDQLKIK